MHLLLVALILCLAGCNQQYINIDNEKYRTSSASGALLGTYGKLLNDQSYESDGYFIHNIQTIVRTQEDFSTSDQLNNSLNLTAMVKNAQLSGKLSPKNVDEKETYVAIVTAPKDPDKLQNDLLQKMAKDKQLFEKAKNPNFRFISQEVSALNYSTATQVTGNSNATLDLNVVDKVAISTDKSREEKIKLSDKTVIAYQLRKLCWKGGVVVDTVEDLPNVGHACPNGSRDVYPGE